MRDVKEEEEAVAQTKVQCVWELIPAGALNQRSLNSIKPCSVFNGIGQYASSLGNAVYTAYVFILCVMCALVMLLIKATYLLTYTQDSPLLP